MSRFPGSLPLPEEFPLPEPLSRSRYILGIWAHPDDECYLSAGVMARMAEAGRRVTVLTATRGEKGTSDPADHDTAHFAARREGELRASLGVLGVHDVRFLGMRDGECDLVDDEVAIRAVAAVMEDLRPDVILTFGPDGITGHADHRLVSRWATEAWRRTGRRSELLYATMTDRHLVRHAGLHEQIGLFSEFGGDEGLGVAEDDLALTASLAGPELDRKRLALAAHGSQTADLAALMGEATYRRWWSTEWFRRPTAAEVAACPLVGPAAAVAGVAA